MDFFVQNLYTIILIPFWLFFVVLLAKFFATIQSKLLMSVLTLASTLYGLIFSIAILIVTTKTPMFLYENSYEILKINKYVFNIGIYVDNLSALMALITCFISLFVQFYSMSYMNKDKSYMRFFALLNMFNFSMLGLVFSPNLFQTYIFWELVGFSSYLLIGFWYKKESASTAAKKAVIINRIGDIGLLTGFIFMSYIVLNFSEFVTNIAIPYSSLNEISSFIYSYSSDIGFIVICMFLLMGSIAKSAQFPLNTWLIDAMEGPTPVSALIHSATMVAAGVFLIARLYPLYSLSSQVLTIISLIGLFTAIICAYFALTQVDIKKILAYSTSSQLGIMFLALGSVGIASGMNYLLSHALIKAMLFLCCGIVIYITMGKFDIRFLGGLRKYIPVCAVCFLIGALALSGIAFSGFSVKESLFFELLKGQHYIYMIILMLVSYLTAFYIFRLYFLIFEGKRKNEDKLVDSNLILTLPIVIFAISIIVLGFVLFKPCNFIFSLMGIMIGIAGLISAYLFYNTEYKIKKIPIFYQLSFNGFYMDKIYGKFANFYNKVSKVCNFIDKYVIDGVISFIKLKVRVCSWVISKMQTGNVQSYLSYSVFLLMTLFMGLILAYSIIIYMSEG